MLIITDPDEFVSKHLYHTCAFHREHPRFVYAGCTCSAAFVTERRPPEEVAEIKAKRRREEEDRILAQAEAIKFRRANPTASGE